MSIKIIALPATDSTSAHAHSLLKQADNSEKLPFVVWAKTQSKGRGQRGADWVSPEGNLYVTFAFSAANVRAEQITQVPLWAATQAAEWALANYGLRLTIKWPNDLLFAGRKLGGILCESAMQGSDGYILIGIGINVAAAPALSGEKDTYETTSLSQALKSSLRLDEVANSFMHFVAEKWTGFAEGTWQQRYNYFAIEPGQSLHAASEGDGCSRVVRYEGGGEMVIADDAGEETALTSASQSRRWFYQQMQNRPMPALAVADIGNSRIKLACYSQAEDMAAEFYCAFDPVKSEESEVRKFEQTLQLIKDVCGTLHVGSVNEKFSRLLREECEDIDLAVSPIPKRNVRVDFSKNYDFSQMGIDRVASCEAFVQDWLSDESRQRDDLGVVINCGTATTIDVLCGTQHLGGWIVPGANLAVTSLKSSTSDLAKLFEAKSELKAVTRSDVLGHDTAEAMSNAAHLLPLGLIKVVEQVFPKQRVGRIVVSGGSGMELAKLLDVRYDQQLTCHGLRLLTLGGMT